MKVTGKAMKRTSSAIRCMSLAGTALIAVSLAPSALHAQDSIKIGLVLPYSGALAGSATEIDDGVNLYIKQHGDMVWGKKIEIIRKDTEGIGPAKARSLAEELVTRDKVDVLAGFVSTPNAIAAADVSKNGRKLMVVMNAPAAFITTESPYIVRTSFSVPQIDQVLGRWAVNRGEVRNAYTIVSNDGSGLDAEQAFQRAFESTGGTIVGSSQLPSIAEPDFSNAVRRAKDLNTQGMFVKIQGREQRAAFAKSLSENGINPQQTKIMGEMDMAEDAELSMFGNTALGMITATNYDYKLHSRTNEGFVQAYYNEFKNNPNFYAVGGYDGMALIVAVLNKTHGKPDADLLIKAAEGLSWESPRGPMSIDPRTHDVVQTVYIRKVENLGGRPSNVLIDQIASAKECPSCPKSGACPQALTAYIAKCNCPRSGACPQ